MDNHLLFKNILLDIFKMENLVYQIPLSKFHNKKLIIDSKMLFKNYMACTTEIEKNRFIKKFKAFTSNN